MKKGLLSALALLTTAAFSSPARPIIPSGLFPGIVEAPEIQRGDVTLRLGKEKPLRLTPVRIEPSRDHVQWANTPWCGVVLTDSADKQQGVVTVGQGYTEVLKCKGLLAAGTLPAARIGLIYATQTPHGGDERVALILARDTASGRWAIDDSATERLSAKSVPKTISDMRRRLTTR